MFNIGVDGQLIIGRPRRDDRGCSLLQDLPASGIPIIGAIIAGVLTGAFWGFIPGFLKARTGAHEVITTIMLNYVAAQVVLFALRSDFLRQPGSTAPISKNLSPIGRRAEHLIRRPAGDPSGLRLRRRAAHGRRRLVVPVPDDARASSSAPPAST